MKCLPELLLLNGLEVERDVEEEEEEEEDEDSAGQEHMPFYDRNQESEDDNVDLNEDNTAFMKDAYGSLSPNAQVEGKENVQEVLRKGMTKNNGEEKKERDGRSGQMTSEIQLDELESVAILYDNIRAIHRDRSPESDQSLAQDFDQHLQRVMQNLSQAVQNSNAPKNMKTVNSLKAKYDLYDI